MGEDSRTRYTFRPSLRVELQEDALSPFGGLVYLREFEEREGLLAPLLDGLLDPRVPGRTAHDTASLLRLAVYRIALGYPDVTDAELLRHDPVLRTVAARAFQDQLPPPLAGKSTLHRFLTDTLSLRPNRRALREATFESALAPWRSLRQKPRYLYVDLDSTELPVHGEQQGARLNGYFKSTCYHALSLSLAPYHTCLGFLVRPGNVHTAHHAAAFVLPLLLRLQEAVGPDVKIVLRADSGFGKEHLLERLEELGFYYLIRVRENPRLLRLSAHIECRLPGRPFSERSAFRHADFLYRPKSWKRERRVVVRSEFEPGKLFPDWTFLLVHLPRRDAPKRVVRTYLKRGAAEQLYDVLKNELAASKLSHRKMVHNQIRAWLTSMAHNLLCAFDHATRGGRPPRRPTTIRHHLLFVAGGFVRHARRLHLRLSVGGAWARLLRRAEARILRRPPRLAPG